MHTTIESPDLDELALGPPERIEAYYEGQLSYPDLQAIRKARADGTYDLPATDSEKKNREGMRRANEAAYTAFDAWCSGGEEVPDRLMPFLRFTDRRLIVGVQHKETPHPDSFLADADDFISKELPVRKSLLVDSRTGGVVLYKSSLNQVFAYRGLGKSIAVNALIRPLLTGQDWLHFRSPGGFKVVLVDGELPQVQLQERLREFTGEDYQGRLKIISPELMADPKRFPVLSSPADQERFIRQVEEFAPDVIILDTLTRCFKFDTNDTDRWSQVNDFLLDLRFRGYCVVLVHHAGKNNTQRGRTDGDDNLDVSIQLDALDKWSPGDGLQFEWKYEKVRHGAWLPGFDAGYDAKTKTWAVLEDNRADQVLTMVAEGKTERQIATAVGVSQKTVNRIKSKAEKRAKLNKRFESVTQGGT